MTTSVDNWFEELDEDQRPLLSQLRKMVLASGEGVVEELKWSQPCYSVNRLFCYLQKAKSHVTLGFQQGAHLPDPDGLLKGTGADMRSIKFSLDADVNKSAIQAIVTAAIMFDTAR